MWNALKSWTLGTNDTSFHSTTTTTTTTSSSKQVEETLLSLGLDPSSLLNDTELEVNNQQDSLEEKYETKQNSEQEEGLTKEQLDALNQDLDEIQRLCFPFKATSSSKNRMDEDQDEEEELEVELNEDELPELEAELQELTNPSSSSSSKSASFTELHTVHILSTTPNLK